MKTDEAIFCIKETRTHSLYVKFELNGTEVPFDVDTGTAVSIISHSSIQKFLPQATLNTTKVILQTCTSEPMKVKGEMVVQVKYGEYGWTLKSYVTVVSTAEKVVIVIPASAACNLRYMQVNALAHVSSKHCMYI